MTDDLWQDLVNAEKQAAKPAFDDHYLVDGHQDAQGQVWVRLEHAQRVVKYTHDEAYRQGQWTQQAEDYRFWSRRLTRRTQAVILWAAGIAGIGFILFGYFSQ